MKRLIKYTLLSLSLVVSGQVLANICANPAQVQYSSNDLEVTITSNSPLNNVTLQFMSGGEQVVNNFAKTEDNNFLLDGNTGKNIESELALEDGIKENIESSMTFRGEGEHLGKRISAVWIDNGCPAPFKQKTSGEFYQKW